MLDRAEKYIKNKDLLAVVRDVRAICAREKDWKKVREYLDPKYGYDVCPGCCHMIPNHAMVLTAIILGEDDFKSQSV